MNSYTYSDFAAVQVIIYIFPDALFPVGSRNWTRSTCVSLLSLPPCVSFCSRLSWFSFVACHPNESCFTRQSFWSAAARSPGVSFDPWRTTTVSGNSRYAIRSGYTWHSADTGACYLLVRRKIRELCKKLSRLRLISVCGPRILNAPYY